MNTALAPIILFVYDRPDHAAKALNALAENELAKKSDLFIFCDGPKKESVKERNRQVIELITAEKEQQRFASVTLTISEVNKGLAASIISGVTEIINRYGKCIVIEDDVIASPMFLTFMNDCLVYYRDRTKIFSISGFTYPLKALQKYPHDVYLSYRACSQCWACWKDRWETIDWEVKDYNELAHSLPKRYRFNRGGNDLYRMLRHQMRGERNSWAIRFCYAQSKQDRYTVYPRATLSLNCGYDGSGTHCEKLDSKKQKTDTTLSGNDFILSYPPLDRRVIREFKAQYRVPILDAIKWAWKKVFGWK